MTNYFKLSYFGLSYFKLSYFKMKFFKPFLLLSLLTLDTAIASTENVQDFVSKIQEHYKQTLPIKAFSLNHHFLNKEYRSYNYWDYQTPNRGMSIRTIEVDLLKKHFYDNDILYSSGGLLFDRVQFQNDHESYFYEKSGVFLGKSFIKQDMNRFDVVTGYLVLKLDFLAVRPLLKESNIKDNISLIYDKQSNSTTLVHKTSDEHIVDYKFNNNPLQLISVNHRPLGGFFTYHDYQTTRGIAYARVVHQYYDGATEPNYVTFNDSFNVIKQVDPEGLKLPKDYATELPKADGVFFAKKIATNLYLVTDSGGRRNSLFKVNGDNITVFGATGSTEVAEKITKLINGQFPNKTIRSVYVTHPHADEIAGLNVYAQKGISILADDYTISAIKAHSKFANDISSFKFSSITHEQMINGAQFFVLESLHAKRQSFVHFKDSAIIFQSDFLNIAFDNTIPKTIPNYTRSFIDFVRNNQLPLNRIVGSYGNNNISVDTMNKAYNAVM